ncbi:hypothetical protein [Aeromonas rivuli]|uniref:hypothetical protein n=1 Tax=Aeromonas rivuli TaxID=648794 RepID=UPI001CCA9DC3|nr:hypothetical protein [Aeromonas rivuli]UBO73718.1 hypothetical protein KYK33_18220 [Aeromonas rivuli]
MKNEILSFMGLKGNEMDKAEFNREKDYIWKKISEITLEMDKKANAEELNKLAMTIPESLKDATQASKRTSEFRNRAKEAKEEAEKSKGLIDKFKADAESAFGRVTDIDLQASNIHDNLKALLKDATLKHDGLTIAYDESTEVIDKIKEIIQEHDELVNTVESIQEYRKDSESNHGKIKSLLSQSAMLKRDIDNIHDEIFGYDSTAEGSEEETRVEGLLDKLNKTYKELRTELSKMTTDIESHKSNTSDFLSKLKSEAEGNYDKYISGCHDSYNEVLHNIKRLLPQAMTAGLASAYNEKIDKEIIEQQKHEKSFNWSIFYLVLISLLPFAINAYRLLSSGDNLIVIIKDTPYLLSAMLPLYIPVLWLAYTTNKSYKLSKRLIEEYTHKGVVSKTFEGLSHQIDELEDQAISEELRVKLLFNIVSVNTENPGKLISNYDKSDHPLMDALDKSAQLADAVTKLSKIPGFSAIAKKLDDQANQIVADKSDKINAVLNSDVDGAENEEAKNTASKDSRPEQAA